jgi:phosphatidylethanolamine-binding protein (PEBP) family uncharacterized protein
MGQPSTSTRRPRQAAGMAMAAAVVFVSSGCGMLGSTASAERLQLELISVSSPRVSDGDPLPADYSCKGSVGNPPLRWSRVPDDTTSVAVVTDSNGLTGGEVNWVVFDIDPRTNELKGKLDLKKGDSLDKTLKGIAAKTIAWGRLTTAHIE